MNTWIEHITSQHDAPVGLRTRGGIGFIQGKEVVSHFVGHPVHYEENREMKPITLDWIPSTGEFEGSWFGWDVVKKCPTYCGYELYTPKAIVWNSIAYPLNFLRLENRMIADIPIGTYEIIYQEGGMKEVVTIPEPVEGTLIFDTPTQPGWDEYLYINERKIVGGNQSGNVYILTKDMPYPIVIDPDYSANTADGYVGATSSVYSTARSTATLSDVGSLILYVQNTVDSGTYYVNRGLLKFDTSGIPDGDTVSNVVMSLYLSSKTTTPNWDVQIVKCDWSSQDPISSGNRDAAFDSILSSALDDNIWKNTSAITGGNTYQSGSLNTAWVSKTGYTYYGLINANDRSNAAGPTTYQQIIIATQEATAGQRPYLTVTHAPQTSKLFALYY